MATYPATDAKGEGGVSMAELLLTLGLGLLYIGCSSSLIMFNKYLMDDSRFPYAVPLTMGHMSVLSLLLLVMLKLRPDMFPSLTDPEKRVTLGSALFVKVAPVAVFFSAQLVLTNTAYLEASVAFLQMMKEGNVVLVYLFSLLCGLEMFSQRRMVVVALIIVATSMTITGEIKFSFTAFCVQGTSQFFESSKIILMSILLSGKLKLDSFTYNLLVAPMCLFLLSGAFVFLSSWHGSSLLQVPSWQDFVAWWPLLLANSVVAFAMNLIAAAFIKQTSAIAFILAGITKDCSIVLSGVLFLSEQISRLQAVGFSLQLCLIGYWSYLKTLPDEQPAEKKPLSPAPDVEADNGAAGQTLNQATAYGTVDNRVSRSG